MFLETVDFVVKNPKMLQDYFGIPTVLHKHVVIIIIIIFLNTKYLWLLNFFMIKIFF